MPETTTKLTEELKLGDILWFKGDALEPSFMGIVLSNEIHLKYRGSFLLKTLVTLEGKTTVSEIEISEFDEFECVQTS